MAEYAELMLEGAGPMIEHYDKVYEPVKERVKKIPQKIPGWKTRSGQDEYEEEEVAEYDTYDSKERGNSDRPREQEVVQYDRYDPPQRSNTERRPRDDVEMYDPPRRSNTERPKEHRSRREKSRHRSRHRSHRRGDRYVEEEYLYERRGGRAKSAGRDGPYGGGGRGLKRDDKKQTREISTVYKIEWY